MNAKNKFLKMFDKLPIKARNELVLDFATNPKTLNVVAMEIRHDTEQGKKMLKQLGYEND